jgi:hypothetical protein
LAPRAPERQKTDEIRRTSESRPAQVENPR